jgi:hypothetical protein
MKNKHALVEPAAAVANTLNQMVEGTPAGVRMMAPERRRILRLLELCRSYTAEARAARKIARPGEELCNLAANGDSSYREINEIVRRYRYRLMVNPAVSPGRNAISSLPNFWYAPGVESGISLIELATAPHILDAMQRGQLRGLRRCKYSRCSKWFYSARRLQRFCPGGGCRERAWAESKVGKENNRLRQARYYATPEGRKKSLERQAGRYLSKRSAH